MAKNGLTKALKVARYLVRIAEADGSPITHLHLQKLLYYVQGWSLALRKKRMFSDPVEAWAYGPVVPNVWHEFKHYGSQVILSDDEPAPKGLSEGKEEFIASVWDAYKEYSALKLTEMTHNESPWKDARKGLPLNSPSQVPISVDSIREYFLTCVKK